MIQFAGGTLKAFETMGDDEAVAESCIGSYSILLGVATRPAEGNGNLEILISFYFACCIWRSAKRTSKNMTPRMMLIMIKND